MVTILHGIDRLNRYFTISVLNRKGEDFDFLNNNQNIIDTKIYFLMEVLRKLK